MSSVHIRDDMDGALGVDFEGRTPNITSTGETWINLTQGENSDWYEFQTQGNGWAGMIYQPGGDGGGGGGALHVGTGVTGVTARCNVRSLNGTSNAQSYAGIGIMRIAIASGVGTSEIIFRAGDLLTTYPSGNGFPDDGDPYAAIAQAGATAECEVSWIGSTLSVKVNGTTVLSTPTIANGTDTTPLDISGDVTVEFWTTGDNAVSYVEIEAVATDAPAEDANCLVKNLLVVGVEQLHMVPGAPYVPAQPGRYSYESQQVCGWQTPGGGHYEQLTDSNGQTRLVWVPNNLPPAGGWIVSTWVCTEKLTPVYHPPIPAQPATPPFYYSTTHSETSFNLGWNAGARSIAIFTGDAAVHFTVPIGVVGVIVGMNIDDGTPVTYNGNTIDYGFYLARGTARIMRNGVMGAPLGAYANETVFRIERTGTGITWKMDGTSVGTATGALTGAGWLEASLYSASDEVCNPAIETFSPPDLTTKHATIAGNLPYLTDFMSDRPYAEMHGNLPALEGLLTQGLITPSYCVMSGDLTIFSGYMTSLTGEVATIAGNLRPMEGLAADHPYATISGLLPPVDGYMLALEGNYRASLNGWAQSTSLMASRSILVVSVLNKLTIGGVFTTQLKQTARFFSTVTMADLWTVRSIQQAILWSRAAIHGLQGVTINGEGEIETWVINMEGDAFGTTQYQNFDFNSYAEIDGHFYGAGAGGLVLLEGDTDDGVPIQSVVSLGKLGSSVRLKKTFEECFLGLSSAGNMFVKVIAEGREFIYKTKAYDPEMQVQRATFGKGLRTNYVTLEIYNEEGADFELDSVQFVAADLVRKT